MKQAYNYSLKVWATSAVLGPVLLMIYQIIDTKAVDGDMFGFYIAAVIYGFLISLPLLLLLVLIVWSLNKTPLRTPGKKVIVSCLNVISIFCLFHLVVAKDGLFTIIYSIPTIGSIWFYKWESKGKELISGIIN